MNSDQIIEKQRAEYQPNFLEHGMTSAGTFQNNLETQYIRYQRLLQHFDLAGASLHDVGCGICDLWGYLSRLPDQSLTYVGTDIVPEMLTGAKERYPSLELHERNILSMDGGSYDYNVQSGLFNLPGDVSEKDWIDFCFAMIDQMFALSSRATSFNFLTVNGTFQAPELYYADPSVIFNYCLQKHSRFVMLDNAYPLYEFTVTIFQPDYLQQVYSSEALAKYF